MAKKKRKKIEDTNEIAHRVAAQATDRVVPRDSDVRAKNPAAVALGRLGGAKGGKARAEKLTPERRSEIAAKAAASRWKRLKP
jgi:hypothetical protein